jgi:hypothetical protein
LKPDPHELAQSAALRPWLVRATTAIAARLRDARAHAELGRFVDAELRLAELLLSLTSTEVDPSTLMPIGVLPRARETFYRDAWTTHRRELDPEIVDPTAGPDAKGVDAARRAPIMGADQVQELRWAIDGATNELRLAAYATYPSFGLPSAAIATWEIRHRDRLTSAASGALSDAQIALHSAVGRLMIKAELR